MRRLQVWHWLFPILIVFSIGFAVIVVMSNFPFLLFTVVIFSLVIVGLAWAFQNGI